MSLGLYSLGAPWPEEKTTFSGLIAYRIVGRVITHRAISTTSALFLSYIHQFVSFHLRFVYGSLYTYIGYA